MRGIFLVPKQVGDVVSSHEDLGNFQIILEREDVRDEITIKIEVSGIKEIVKAWGSEKLTFTHLKDMVIRKSQYVCGRTIAVKANKAALDLSRRLIEKLKNPKSVVKITLTAMLLE